MAGNENQNEIATPSADAARNAVSGDRHFAGPVLFSQGFRPFFLLAGLWGATALALSVAALSGAVNLPAVDPLAWHAHEMLFGFAAAGLAGFLLTAIPNWTGRLPLRGWPLIVLVGLWCLGRLALPLTDAVGWAAAASLGLAFPLALLGAAGREVMAGRNWRNLPVVGGLAALSLAQAFFLAEALGGWPLGGAGHRLAIATFVAMIALVGGRIVPSFTGNWLKAQHGAVSRTPAGSGAYDRLCLLTAVAALLAWTVAPVHVATGLAAALASACHLGRLARWRGQDTWREPLVLVLHLGYLWLPLGFALIAVDGLTAGTYGAAAIHALTVGAVGTMLLAVMSRATLGHTGRGLRAGPGLTAAYGLVSLAAVTRVGATLWADHYLGWLHAAAGAWFLAFALFVAICGPMLVASRPSAG